VTAKRATRSAVLWGTLFGVLVLNEALGYHKNFPTAASRETFARTFGANAGLTAIVGPARRLGTIGGFVAWRMFFLMIIVGAIWGLLTATRLLRGEEDSGRWELFLAGRTTRRQAAVQAIAGLAVGWLVLWALTAALSVIAGLRPSVGFPVSASMFYATAGTASAAIFVAIGALTSELCPTRRSASGLAAAVFAVAYLVRMVADAGHGLAWMRWVSPLGWVENLSPLTGSRPVALVPIVMLVTAASGAAVALAGRRDLDAAVLASAPAAKGRTRMLGGAFPLVCRLERWVALAWIGGLGALALIFAMVARSAAQANTGAGTVERTVQQLGGHQGGVTSAWIGYTFLYIAAVVAFSATAQISAMRAEEADGRLDNLIARPVSRAAWLAGRIGFAMGVVLLTGLAIGIGGWIGVASEHGDIGLDRMLQAGLNTAVPGLFVLGAGALLYGLAPRLAAPLLYVLVLWSFLVEIIGSSLTTNHWLLDSAVLSHLGPVPAAHLNWVAIGWLTGLGVLAAAAGFAAFGRRDLAAA